MCKGDINADGLTDLFIGGASGQAGKLFVQSKDGVFSSTNEDLFSENLLSEDFSKHQILILVLVLS